MRSLAPVAFLAVSCVCLSSAALLSGSEQQELDIYQAQVRVVQDLLTSACPSLSKSKKAVIGNGVRADLEEQKLLYRQLLQDLIKCHSNNGKIYLRSLIENVAFLYSSIIPA